MTSTEKDCCDPGSRLPAIYFRRVNGVTWLYVASDINENPNYVYEKPESSIQIGKKVNIRVQQALFRANYLFAIFINGRVVWGLNNEKPREFAHVKLYCGDPWYTAQEGNMNNLEVSNY